MILGSLVAPFWFALAPFLSVISELGPEEDFRRHWATPRVTFGVLDGAIWKDFECDLDTF